jgi:hypothetical protein
LVDWLLISNTQNVLATKAVVYRKLSLPQIGPLLVKPIQVLLEYISQNLRPATQLHACLLAQTSTTDQK